MIHTKNNPVKSILQDLVASNLFPSGDGQKDWYKAKGYIGNTDQERFKDFLEKQTMEGGYYRNEFKDLQEISRDSIPLNTPYIRNAKLDLVKFTPKDNLELPGCGKHIVNFFGANTYYEGNFRDMANEANATGATIYGFNYPGFNSSNGKVKEFADLVDSGVAVINKLLDQGIRPDDIVLQGDCFGAAVAEKVKQHFKEHETHLRTVNSNSFVSFESAIYDYFDSSVLLRPFKAIVSALLSYTGWNADVSDIISRQDPFLFQMQREGDGVLINAQLKKHIDRNREQNRDNCPEEYRATRDELEQQSLVKLKDEYQVDARTGQRNEPHMMDLYQLETSDGKPVFNLINKYLEASNQYLKDHSPNRQPPQQVPNIERPQVSINQDDMNQLRELANVVRSNNLVEGQGANMGVN